MVIGYLRVYNNNLSSIAVQKDMLKRYCYEHDMTLDKIFTDNKKVKTRKKQIAQELSNIGYRESYRGEASFPEFDQLLVLIATGNVERLLVDVKMRLCVNTHLDQFFAKLCQKYNVEVIEVGSYVPGNSSSAICTAVYHNTNNSKIRPVYCVNDFDGMYEVAHRNRWAVTSAFIDVSRYKGGRSQYQILLNNLQKYDIVVARAMFNIDMKTGKFMQYLYEFKESQVKLFTLSSGEIILHNDNLIMEKGLRIVLYDSFSSNQEEASILEKIMNTFINYKTNWKLISHYYEGKRVRIDGEHKILEEILTNQNNWDAVLVKSFSRINERCAKFESILKRLSNSKLIYSIEEGAYLYGKKEESSVL